LNISYFAAQQGADKEELIALSSLSEEDLGKESCFVDDATYNAVIERAVEYTGDTFFGLHVGEAQNLSAAGLIVQISQSSETVKQALEFCCQFANLGCSALPMELIEEEAHYKIRMTPSPLWLEQSPIAVQHTAMGVITFTLKEFDSLVRSPHPPIAIHLSWPRPADLSEYERVWKSPLHFNQNEIAILLRKDQVEQAVITSDYHLLRVLIAHAEERSAQIKQRMGFTSVVKQSVVNLVKPEFPKIEQVARHLNLSLRTLQRRLSEEGYTYKRLIDELKKEFAISYLKRPDLSISEVAYLLDYADNSAFNRSFKRWTGQTPGLFRSTKNTSA